MITRRVHAWVPPCASCWGSDAPLGSAAGHTHTHTKDDLGEEYVELGCGSVAKAYLQSWFWPDLVSGVPLGLLTSNSVAGQLTYIKVTAQSGRAQPSE